MFLLPSKFKYWLHEIFLEVPCPRRFFRSSCRDNLACKVEAGVAMQRVLVVDDHPVIRKGTQSILGAWPEWQVSGEAASGEEARKRGT
jgi:hypothetical protein